MDYYPQKKTERYRYRVRAIGERGATYDCGIFYGVDEYEAIERCRDEGRRQYPYMWDGIRRFEAWRLTT